jgi:hypothetical protein
MSEGADGSPRSNVGILGHLGAERAWFQGNCFELSPFVVTENLWDEAWVGSAQRAKQYLSDEVEQNGEDE